MMKDTEIERIILSGFAGIGIAVTVIKLLEILDILIKVTNQENIQG